MKVNIMKSVYLGLVMALASTCISLSALALAPVSESTVNSRHECPDSAAFGPIGHECPDETAVNSRHECPESAAFGPIGHECPDESTANTRHECPESDAFGPIGHECPEG